MFKTIITSAIIFCLICTISTVANALTPEQVLALKQAGITDQTIQMMIRQENDVKLNTNDQLGMREIKDSDGNPVVIYSTGRTPQSTGQDQQDVDHAWDMLRHIIIDRRQ